MLPPALGNFGPAYRVALTIGAGPRRAVEDGDKPRLYIPRAGPRLRKTPAPDLARCRNILVVALDFIGDWVLTIPFLENLRRNAPHAQISVVVLDRVFALAQTCRFADRVVSLCRAEGRRVVFGSAQLAILAGFCRDYRDARFDLAIVPRFDADFNGAVAVAHGSGARWIVGFSEASTSRKRGINRGDDRFLTTAIVDPRPVAHEFERALALIEALGGKVAAKLPSLDLLPADRDAAARFLGGRGKQTKAILVVAPFGSGPSKTLPADILSPNIRALAGRFALDVVVMAGPGDAGHADAFARAVGGRSTAGSLGLRATAALLGRATAFIGMDSGPAHMAAAMRIPVAVIVAHPEGGDPGHTGAPERFAPLGAAGRILVVRPPQATPPCVAACDAGEAHCILGLSPDLLDRQLSAFLVKALNGATNSRSRQARASAMDARV